MNFSELRAVVVDDSEHALPLIVELTEMMGFKVKGFSCPLQACAYIKTNPVDIVFTDYKMPRMNGLALMEESQKAHPDVPVVMITAGGNDPKLKKKAYEKNAADFFDKPFSNAEFVTRVRRLGHLRQYRKYMTDIKLKDSGFGKHTTRVSRYASLIARGLKLSARDQDLLFYAAGLHDIGNHSISDSILSKPDRLSHNEMETVKNHTRIGYDILQLRENPYLEAGSIIALTHHERFDGSGYPLRLSGAGIPAFGRITALADVFDVLTSGRPYKTAWSFEDALEFIKDNADSLFDPDAVAVFTGNILEVRAVYTQFADA